MLRSEVLKLTQGDAGSVLALRIVGKHNLETNTCMVKISYHDSQTKDLRQPSYAAASCEGYETTRDHHDDMK
jgi:hypothetical protein